KAASPGPARSSEAIPVIGRVASAPGAVLAPVKTTRAATSTGTGAAKKTGSLMTRSRQAKRAADLSTAPSAKCDRSKPLAGAEAQPLRVVRLRFGERLGEISAQESDRRTPQDGDTGRASDRVVVDDLAAGRHIHAP